MTIYELENINVDGTEIPQLVIPIVGDGACLFNSLSFILYNTQDKSLEVRKTITSYVAENWDDFHWMTHDSNGHNYSTSAKYISEMSKHSVYGGTCELVAAGKIFPYIFEVYFQKNLYETFGSDIHPIKRLRFTGNINHGHFEVYLSTFEENVLHNFSANMVPLPITDINISQNNIPSDFSSSNITVLNKVSPGRGRRSNKKSFNFQKKSQEQSQKDCPDKSGYRGSDTSRNTVPSQKESLLISTRPKRAAKTSCANRIVGIMIDLNDSCSQEDNNRKKRD